MMASICLIALDRHHMIVNVTRAGNTGPISLLYILSVWVLAILAAVPIVPNTRLNIVEITPGRRFLCSCVLFPR